MIHLIYKSKIFESGSKDYDFSRVGMVEHWRAGEEDVRVTMLHPECFDASRRPARRWSPTTSPATTANGNPNKLQEGAPNG